MNKVRLSIILSLIVTSSIQSFAVEIVFGPYVQFLTPHKASLMWQTAEPSEGLVTLKLEEELITSVISSPTQKNHQVILNDLAPYKVYSYQIEVKRGDESFQTEEFALEQKMNYSLPVLEGDLYEFGMDNSLGSSMDELLLDADINKGFAVIYGSEFYPFAFDLAKQSEMMVILLDHDMERVQTAREELTKAGAYGTRVNVRFVDDYTQVPITSNFANLIITPKEIDESGVKTMLNILCPFGGTVYTKNTEEQIKGQINGEQGYTITSTTISGESFTKIVKHDLPGAGKWSHQYGNPANNANGGEMLTGASKTTDLSVQWVGKPGANFGIDRNPRMPAPIAVSGRLFHQGMNRMVALDAYNGSILWSLEIPHLRRVNLPHDCSNWCGDDDYLFTAIKDQCWKIRQSDGMVKTYFELPESVQGNHDWGFIARTDDMVFGSAVKKGTIYTEFFGKETWYDQQEGEGASKVCSVNLFALDHEDGGVKWDYEVGSIINSTISIADGNVFFVESRNPAIKALDIMRVGDDLLWSDQFLVALNAETGEKVWEQAIDTVDGKAVFFMIHGDDKLVISSSADEYYHIYAFDASNGKQIWEQKHKWTDGDHSGHMQHPLIVANSVFLEPNGYDIETGKRITENMGLREGCSTYAAVANALIYRGEDRRIAMWDRHSEEVTSWVNLRPSCWLSVIPAGGMVLAPEGGGGCSCGNWIETSLSFMPISLFDHIQPTN